MENDHTPLTLAVSISIALLAFVVVVGGTIGGSYWVAESAIHKAQVAQAQEQAASAQAQARARTTQLRQSIPTCDAIHEMDKASDIPKWGFPKPPHNIYDRRLSAAIHDVDSTSHCALILEDLSRHMSYAQILKQLQGS